MKSVISGTLITVAALALLVGIAANELRGCSEGYEISRNVIPLDERTDLVNASWGYGGAAGSIKERLALTNHGHPKGGVFFADYLAGDLLGIRWIRPDRLIVRFNDNALPDDRSIDVGVEERTIKVRFVGPHFSGVDGSAVPEVPTGLEVVPGIPGDAPARRVKGIARGGTWVTLYGPLPDCSGIPVGFGSVKEFHSKGIPVRAGQVSIRTFRATVENDLGLVSECSSATVPR